MALSNKRQRFCEEYVVDFNAKQAAIRAGYKPDNAQVVSSQLMAKIEVQLYIEELKTRSVGQLQIEREDVIRELYRIGLADVRRLFDKDGRLKRLIDLDDDLAAAVESMELAGPGGNQTHKVKMSSKLAALKELAKHFNIYEDHQRSGQSRMIVNFGGKFMDV